MYKISFTQLSTISFLSRASCLSRTVVFRLFHGFHDVSRTFGWLNFRACQRSHMSCTPPCSLSVALVASYMLFRTCRRLHVFPRLPPVTYYPALAAAGTCFFRTCRVGHVFSRACCRLHVFPRFPSHHAGQAFPALRPLRGCVPLLLVS